MEEGAVASLVPECDADVASGVSQYLAQESAPPGASEVRWGNAGGRALYSWKDSARSRWQRP